MAFTYEQDLEQDGYYRQGLVFKSFSNTKKYSDMISEREFAHSFQSFWNELLPLLTPNYVHLINETYKNHITDKNGRIIPKIEDIKDNRYPSIVAEYAFNIAKEAFNKKKSIGNIVTDKELLNDLELITINSLDIKNEEFVTSSNLLLNDLEINYAINLALNYELFIELFPKSSIIEYKPRMNGAGIINNCFADISIDDVLIEVKTVNRNLASSDIKQVLTYLALKYSMGEHKWRKASIFNPRRSIYLLFDIEELISMIAGQKSSIEIFQEIIDFAFSQSIPLDNMF